MYMFMFRDKEKIKSVAEQLSKEAVNFQLAYDEIYETIKFENITFKVIEAFAEKYNIDAMVLFNAYKVILEKNAIEAVKKIKLIGDYTILDLEKTVLEYGFELDDLNITYFSED